MIPTFKEWLEEKYINLLPRHENEKRKHADEVHALLTKSYESQGGVHQDLKTPEDMIKNIPMWKIHKKDGKIKSVALYKDTHGRKRVAVGTDETPEGKESVAKLMKQDIEHKRSYGETSGKSLSFMKKQVGGDIRPHAKTYEEAQKVLHDKELRRPSEDDVEIKKHPELKDHFYQRKIGDHWHTKLMYGTEGNKIK